MSKNGLSRIRYIFKKYQIAIWWQFKR